MLGVIYGSPQERGRNSPWDIKANYDLPWCVLGDFNMVLFDHERLGGEPVIPRSCLKSEQCMNDCHLIDLGYHGPEFTWKRGDLRKRLDRALGNEKWQEAFPNSSITHLPIQSSNHCGLWVANSWRKEDPWETNIQRLTKNLSVWNRESFGDIFRRKKRIIGRLEGIECKLILGDNERLSLLKKDLWHEYTTILNHEEAYSVFRKDGKKKDYADNRL